MVPKISFFLLVLVASTLATELYLNKLTNPHPADAKCLDGTPPAYFFSKGHGSGSNKWFIFHEGGGWCISLGDCYNRSLIYFGSSNPYPPSITLDYGYFSADRTESPFWNWNKAYLKYCDGGSFTGNNNTVTYFEGHPLYFRGFKNLQAIRNSLWNSQGLDKAREVVIAGCSAGGLSTYLHLDWWADNVPTPAKVRGLVDSGFFPDFNSDLPGGGHFADEMRWVARQMNSTMDRDCMRANHIHKVRNRGLGSHGSQEDCIFAEHVVPYVKTPTFSIQAIYDKYQTDFMLGATDWFTDAIYNVTAANDYGTYFLDKFTDTVLANPNNGAFLDACHHHCFGSLKSLTIDGTSIASAWNKWYAPHVYIQPDPFPCVECCPAGGP